MPKKEHEWTTTYKAIASALCSMSSHASDIQETFRGWEKVPKICVKTTPK